MKTGYRSIVVLSLDCELTVHEICIINRKS